jgi:hypothetical protein
VNPAPQTTTLRAETLPSPLAGLAGAAGRGIVLAAFDRSLYLDLDGQVVALASSELSRGPIVITLRHPGAIPAVNTGAPVRLHGGRLHVGPVEVDLRDATVWDPTLLPPAGATARSAARSVVIDELLAAAPDESIADLLGTRRDGGAPHSLLLASLSKGLGAIDAWLSGRLDAASASAIVGREVAGRGPGLTPSGDDLLVGIMLGVGVLPGAAGVCSVQDVRDVLASAAMPRTTRISGAYLDAARHGWASEPWHALVRALVGQPEHVRGAARRLLGIGETSGADTLTGFCWVWRDR